MQGTFAFVCAGCQKENITLTSMYHDGLFPHEDVSSYYCILSPPWCATMTSRKMPPLIKWSLANMIRLWKISDCKG